MRLRLFLLLALVIAGLTPWTRAQDKSVNPGINDRFKDPDLKEFLGKFEIESREIFTQREEIVKGLKLKPGMAVADVGAGTGLLTRLIAAKVGPKGKVYAVDIADRFLKHIASSAKEKGLTNIVTVKCDQFSTKLPPNSVDLLLVCDTYHHFEYPYRTLESIHHALKPGGQFILIDFHRIPGKSSKFILGHVRAGQEVFMDEVRSSGFKRVEELKFLSENYFVRFEREERKGK